MVYITRARCILTTVKWLNMGIYHRFLKPPVVRPITQCGLTLKVALLSVVQVLITNATIPNGAIFSFIWHMLHTKNSLVSTVSVLFGYRFLSPVLASVGVVLSGDLDIGDEQQWAPQCHCTPSGAIFFHSVEQYCTINPECIIQCKRQCIGSRVGKSETMHIPFSGKFVLVNNSGPKCF